MLTDEKFAPLSLASKILYGVLLDRMALSVKNGWLDKDQRVYIIFKIEEIQELLGFSKKKSIEYLGELENFGLVEKKRRGLGLPSILYIKSFLVTEAEDSGTSGGVEIDTFVSEKNEEKVSESSPDNGTVLCDKMKIAQKEPKTDEIANKNISVSQNKKGEQGKVCVRSVDLGTSGHHLRIILNQIILSGVIQNLIESYRVRAGWD